MKKMVAASLNPGTYLRWASKQERSKKIMGSPAPRLALAPARASGIDIGKNTTRVLIDKKGHQKWQHESIANILG